MASAITSDVQVAGGDSLYEVIHGEIVEIAPMGIYETWIASLLHVQLHLFAAKELGRVVVEPLFDFTRATGNKRRPDLAFVSYQRWSRDVEVPQTEAWDVVPNLAVEVISPSNSARDVLDKVLEYFQVGVERVWIVYPTQRLVYVYTTPTDVDVVGAGGELVDDYLMPGFRLPLSVLFGPAAGAK